jgi:nitronate monooxygenase
MVQSIPFADQLALPLIGAPMFIASYPELVIAQCQAGVLGTFPSLNARSTGLLDEWLTRIASENAAFHAANPTRRVAPFGMNLILHPSNTRREEDLALAVSHRVPLVITSVGKPDRVCPTVQSYGGRVFHDIISVVHARKALDCGVDGLILVCAGRAAMPAACRRSRCWPRSVSSSTARSSSPAPCRTAASCARSR